MKNESGDKDGQPLEAALKALRELADGYFIDPTTGRTQPLNNYGKTYREAAIKDVLTALSSYTPIEEQLNRVMAMLRDTGMEHGLCEPRERRACTACNASDDLVKLAAEWKGPRVKLAGPEYPPAQTARMVPAGEEQPRKPLVNALGHELGNEPIPDAPSEGPTPFEQWQSGDITDADAAQIAFARIQKLERELDAREKLLITTQRQLIERNAELGSYMMALNAANERIDDWRASFSKLTLESARSAIPPTDKGDPRRLDIGFDAWLDTIPPAVVIERQGHDRDLLYHDGTLRSAWEQGVASRSSTAPASTSGSSIKPKLIEVVIADLDETNGYTTAELNAIREALSARSATATITPKEKS